MGDVLVDAGAKPQRRRILKQLEGGTSRRTPSRTHTPTTRARARRSERSSASRSGWGEGDVDKAENPLLIKERQPSKAAQQHLLGRWPARPKVDRALQEGDEVAGFTVLDTPGHSKGHVSFWRESDRVLILGDVLNNMDIYTVMRGLKQPKQAVTPDPARNRASIRGSRALDPKLVVFGHGPPLRDTEEFRTSARAKAARLDSRPMPADRLKALEERTRYEPGTRWSARVFARWEEAGIFHPGARGRRGRELLDRGPAAERDRRAAHGPRAERLDPGPADPPPADAGRCAPSGSSAPTTRASRRR